MIQKAVVENIPAPTERHVDRRTQHRETTQPVNCLPLSSKAGSGRFIHEMSVTQTASKHFQGQWRDFMGCTVRAEHAAAVSIGNIPK